MDAAQLSLLLDAGQRQGLIKADFEVDVDRCNETLRHGQRFSIIPRTLEAAFFEMQHRKGPTSSTELVPG